MRLGRIVVVLLLITAGAAGAVAPARFVSFGDARPILSELSGRLPPELNALTPAQMERAWPAWLERHDREVRARPGRARCWAPSNRVRPGIVSWCCGGRSS